MDGPLPGPTAGLVGCLDRGLAPLQSGRLGQPGGIAWAGLDHDALRRRCRGHSAGARTLQEQPCTTRRQCSQRCRQLEDKDGIEAEDHLEDRGSVSRRGCAPGMGLHWIPQLPCDGVAPRSSRWPASAHRDDVRTEHNGRFTGIGQAASGSAAARPASAGHLRSVVQPSYALRWPFRSVFRRGRWRGGQTFPVAPCSGDRPRSEDVQHHGSLAR
mmetsp:Transcript_70732/g.153606  ORF Transcript_70732/g.153606 Transcript_70732/m.153606 type:complete len:214 (-) Transcript_70732:581-1222(-)